MPIETKDCPYCEARHTARFLCDPAKSVLDALIARGMSFTMPTLEFPAPIDPMPSLGQPGDALLRQLVVQGATVEDAGGRHRAMLIFTGQDITGRPLPRWMYPATGADMKRAVALVEEMSALAVRTARQKNGGR